MNEQKMSKVTFSDIFMSLDTRPGPTRLDRWSWGFRTSILTVLAVGFNLLAMYLTLLYVEEGLVMEANPLTGLLGINDDSVALVIIHLGIIAIAVITIFVFHEIEPRVAFVVSVIMVIVWFVDLVHDIQVIMTL